jgi:predicted nucleic acid-binding protein
VTTQISIIIDTNIIFSSLLQANSKFYNFIVSQSYNYWVGEYCIVELFKNKEKMIKLSKMTEIEIIEAYYTILRKVNLYKEDLMTSEIVNQAYNLCKDIDENDTTHVALTLELNGLLWTGDKKLKEGLLKKGFTQFFEPNS